MMIIMYCEVDLFKILYYFTFHCMIIVDALLKVSIMYLIYDF